MKELQTLAELDKTDGWNHGLAMDWIHVSDQLG